MDSPTVIPATVSIKPTGVKLALHASEAAGHWYTREGKQVETVPSADGKSQVKPTITHARKLLLLPGVTTIVRCAAAPGLESWKVTQGIMAALTLPRRPHEPDVEFLKRVLADSREQGKKAADEGTAIHGAIERYYQNISFDPAYEAYVVGVRDALNSKFGTRRWKAEMAFAHRMGFASKIDLHDPEFNTDFKSKDFTEPPTTSNVSTKLHWDEHVIQGAAYNHGIWNEQTRPFFNVFISRPVPGLVHIHEWPRDELQRGWEMFKSLHAYWCAKNKYSPGWIAP